MKGFIYILVVPTASLIVLFSSSLLSKTLETSSSLETERGVTLLLFVARQRMGTVKSFKETSRRSKKNRALLSPFSRDWNEEESLRRRKGISKRTRRWVTQRRQERVMREETWRLHFGREWNSWCHFMKSMTSKQNEEGWERRGWIIIIVMIHDNNSWRNYSFVEEVHHHYCLKSIISVVYSILYSNGRIDGNMHENFSLKYSKLQEAWSWQELTHHPWKTANCVVKQRQEHHRRLKAWLSIPCPLMLCVNWTTRKPFNDSVILLLVLLFRSTLTHKKYHHDDDWSTD